MTDLVKIEQRGGIATVNARELWKALKSKQDFSTWVKSRIEGFSENVDFTLHKFVEGKATKIDYYLTIDTAKHLCMLERNEIGKKIRQYFIDVEKQKKQPAQLTGPALMAAALIEAQKTLSEMQPKAELADRMLNTGNLRTITDFGKIIARPRKIFTDLQDKGILYRNKSDGVLLPYQKYIDEGFFVVRLNIVKIGDHEERKQQTYLTAKGEEWLANTIYAPRLKL
jgi:anti-repressor protein